MKISISQTKPTTKPIREYETRFVYVGLKYRYDTHVKKLSSIEKHSDGSITYSELSPETQVFSRGYASELTRVIVYSDSPRVWCEETSPTDFVMFNEVIPQN
jgi:hypothetical protein